MNCPPPLSSDDEDDDFGDFSTFEKAAAAAGGSIKSRIHLDSPLSPEPTDTPIFTIPPKRTDSSIGSDSSPPELPPSLPMSPETPDVDFFNRPRGSSPPPFHFQESSSPFSESQENDLFSTDALKEPSTASRVPMTDDFFANFETSEKNEPPADEEIFPSESDTSNIAQEVEHFDVDFTDFSVPVSAEKNESKIDDSSEFAVEVGQIHAESDKSSAKDDNVNTGPSNSLNEIESTESSSAVDTSKLECVLNQVSVNPLVDVEGTSKEITAVSQAKEEEIVPFFDSTTPSPVTGVKSVFSWDSFEENIDVDACEKKTEDFPNSIRPDDGVSDNDLKDKEDDFHGFVNFDTKPTENTMSFDQTECDSSNEDRYSEKEVDFFADKNEKYEENVLSDNMDVESSDVEKVNSDKFKNFSTEETDNSTHPEDHATEGVGDFADFGAPSNDENPSTKTTVDATEYTAKDDGGINDNFGTFDYEEPSTSSNEGLDDNFDEFGAFDDKKPSDDVIDNNFGDFGAFDNEKSPAIPDDDLNDDFGNFGEFDNEKPTITSSDGLDDEFGDFGAFDNDGPTKTVKENLDDDFGDFGTFDNDGRTKTAEDNLDDDFGDFGAFDNEKLSAKTSFDDELDDDFDDFADFGSASQKSDLKPSAKDTSQPISLSKMISECYGDCEDDKGKDVGSGNYSDGLLLITKVQDTDAQFAVGTKWLTTPSFNTQVNTLCLSSSHNSSSTSKPAQAQNVEGDEFSVFGSAETDKKLSDQTLVSSGLFPEDLSTTQSPAPVPSKKHAAILSGYKKEETKQLSREAAAIVDSLPDLSFMLSSVLMFPVKSS